MVVGTLLRNPEVQTMVSKSVAAYLTRQMDMEVHIGEVNLSFYGTFLIDDFEILDGHNHKMITVDRLEIRLDGVDRRDKIVDLNSVKLTGVDFALRKYSGDDLANLGYFLQNFKSKRSADTIQKQQKSVTWIIACKSLEFRNMHFVNENQERKKEGLGIDFNDIELFDMDLLMSNLKVEGDTISARINSLAFIEKSGFEIKDFSGMARFCPTGLSVDNLLAHTNNSTLDLDFKFSYDDLTAFNDFVNKVHADASFRETNLEMSDIGYFAPVMFSMTDLIKFSGDFSGYVSNFRGRDFDLLFGKNTHFTGSLRMNGLPDITETFIHADFRELTTSPSDINNFALPSGAGPIHLPEILHKMGVISIKGKFTGFYNDFVSNAEFVTELGALKTDIILKAAEDGDARKLIYSGKLLGRELDIGKLFSLESTLGKTNFSVDVDGAGIDIQNLEIEMVGAVRSLDFNGYDYRNIQVDGQLVRKVFNGILGVNDKNLNLDFLGLIDFNETMPIFNFTSRIRNADLFNLKITHKDTVSIFSTDMKIDFAGVDIDNLAGSIILSNTSYLKGEQMHTMDTLSVKIFEDSVFVKHINLESDFIDAYFGGDFSIKQLGASINQFIRNYSGALAGNYPANRNKFYDQDITFQINLKSPQQLTSLFVPNLDIAPGTHFEGEFCTDKDRFLLNGSSSLIDFSNIKIRDWKLAVSSDQGSFKLNTFGHKVFFSEPNQNDTLGIGIDSLSIHATISSDTIRYHILWNDMSNRQSNTGDFAGFVAFKSLDAISLKFTDVSMVVDSSEWVVHPDNLMVADTAGIFFRDLMFYNDSSQFSVNGGISENSADTLKLIFDDLNISHLDQLIISQKVDLNGVLNGKALFVNLYEIPNFLVNVELKDLQFNGQDFGLLRINTTWDEEQGFLDVDLDILNEGNIGISETLNIDGRYFPTSELQNFDLNVQLNNLNTHILNPFISEFVDIDKESLASGNLEVTGSYTKPVIKGKVNLMRTQFLIKYLNVLYSAGGNLEFGENFISINQLMLYDTRRSSASCTGNIYHDYFRNFNLDIVINQENISALNTTSRDNELFYGTAIVSGQVDIDGPLDDINMNISARTEDGTRIMIPISSSVSVSENDFIIFINNTDTTQKEKEEESYKVDMKGLTINFDFQVTSAADIQIFLPYDMGNIKGNGDGEIRMGINPRGDFTINGDYNIEEGEFFFTLEKLFKRRFKIKSGSKISWTGSPYDATVDITAMYPVKTTLTGMQLQTDSTSLYNTRVNVECIVTLKNDLFNPDMKFTIDFANVAEDVKQIIYASLDTTDQSVMSRQMVSLLVLGNFSYSSGTPNIGVTGFKLLSNQLSDWLSKISKDFDIGVNYKPGTKLTEDELEVALRTQLFNDRLLIDGNFGVRGTNKVENTGNVVGDINVEYKITEDGHFRIKAFNRSNDISFLEDNAPYTQGVGVFYRREFEKFGDLFRSGKREKKNKDKRNKSRSTLTNDAAVREDE